MGGGNGSDSIDRARLNSINQETALASQLAGLAGKADARQQKAFDQTFPFFTNRMQNGLPFINALTDYAGGTTDRAFGPARGAMERRLANLGDLPSGFAEQSRADLSAQEARAFDDQMRQALMENDQAKMAGAAGLTGQLQINNPLGYYNSALNGYQGAGSINPTPQQPNPALGALGGAIGGALSFF